MAKISHSNLTPNNEPLDFNQVLNDNVGLVVHIVNRLKVPKKHIEDCMQLGYIGLWKASKIFQPEKGCFTTIAWKCISREITRFVSKEKRHIYVELPDTIHYTDKNINDYLPILSETEISILNLKLQNYTVTEITQKLNLSSRQTTSRMYHTILNKVRVGNA